MTAAECDRMSYIKHLMCYLSLTAPLIGMFYYFPRFTLGHFLQLVSGNNEI